MPELELWQFAFSHFNEKARWSLDYKKLPHRRRTFLPGMQVAPVMKLTGQTSVPVLLVDGKGVFDSTRIIETLERLSPEARLYPTNAAERDRALELENFFDEELGPYDRQLLFYLVLPYPGFVVDCFGADSGLAARTAYRAAMPAVSIGMRRMMKIDAKHAEIAKSKTLAAFDRLESELGQSEYLVGETFSVADLTAAALLSPIVLPREFPYLPKAEIPEPMQNLRDELCQRRGYKWVEEMYRRHRGSSSSSGAMDTTAAD